ncbi:MAG: peptidylprolyl isomerase, partial [Clostridia bacterium]|nr:peptidylprolyl isomerase [Clostridia bacterium]
MVVIEMEKGGIIKLALDAAAAPNTVKNFKALASKGFYDGLTFHRVISGFMIQG